jgi:cellulose synthase/poly-beta-1,6-N-acetylglucosamine synthase-like glycosyltransferase
MKRHALGAWNVDINKTYVPSTVILVPVYNEEKTIHWKLENITRIKYPWDKIEIIILNDASTDASMDEVKRFVAEKPTARIRILDHKEHLGKVGCLNKALTTITCDVVIISDADCFWPDDILQKALPYLSDPEVGAITCRELLLNPKASWVTLGEQFYDTTVQAIRLGESKLYATIIFQGGFAAFKRSILSQFNLATDDSGTALDIVQSKKRTILIPETGFYTITPQIWQNKIAIKIRRASHLQRLWVNCLKLLLHRQLALPKRIAIPEILLHIVNPLALIAVVMLSIPLFFLYPLPMVFLVILVLGLLVVKKTRTIVLELLQNNLILLAALPLFIGNNKFTFWKPIPESRNGINEQILKQNSLL